MFREVGHDKFYEFKYGADFIIVYDPGEDGDKSHSLMLKYIGAVFDRGIDNEKAVAIPVKREQFGCSSFNVSELDIPFKHLDSPSMFKEGIENYFTYDLQFTANSGHVIQKLKEGSSRLYLSITCSRLHLRLGPAKSETVKTDLAVIVYENKEVLGGHLRVYTRLRESK